MAWGDRSSSPAFKGQELYSWREGPNWIYVILPGTNRNKNWPELLAAPSCQGEDELRRALAQLAVGEMVFWSNRCQAAPPGRLAYPPAAVRESLRNFCEEQKVVLCLPHDVERRSVGDRPNL